MDLEKVEPMLFIRVTEKIVRQDKPDYVLKVLLDSETALAYNDVNKIYQIMSSCLGVSK